MAKNKKTKKNNKTNKASEIKKPNDAKKLNKAKKTSEPRDRSKLYLYLLCSLFAALTAVFSQIMIPLVFTPVPINLALLAVWICGGVLGAKKGAIAILVYILLGAIGVPVFHGLTGGFGVLAGPTGGYIVGYLPAVIIFGLLAKRYIPDYSKESGRDYKKTAARIFIALVIGLPALAACYAIGTAWFMITSGTGFLAALWMCVIPFIPGDLLKLALASVVLEALRKRIRALGSL